MMATGDEIAERRARSTGFALFMIITACLGTALLLAPFLFYKSFSIHSDAMNPALLNGDYLWASRTSYGINEHAVPVPVSFERLLPARPERGDVAVFVLPRDTASTFVSRVVGLPGETIELRGGTLLINGTAVPKAPAGDFKTRAKTGRMISISRFRETLPNGVSYDVLDQEPAGPGDNAGPFQVPADHYFVLGDNRDNASDSRFPRQVGTIPFDNFYGRALRIFFSRGEGETRWDRFGTAVE